MTHCRYQFTDPQSAKSTVGGKRLLEKSSLSTHQIGAKRSKHNNAQTITSTTMIKMPDS